MLSQASTPRSQAKRAPRRAMRPPARAIRHIGSIGRRPLGPCRSNSAVPAPTATPMSAAVSRSYCRSRGSDPRAPLREPRTRGRSPRAFVVLDTVLLPFVVLVGFAGFIVVIVVLSHVVRLVFQVTERRGAGAHA